MDAEKELDVVLAALARVEINGAQQLAEAKRRFLMLLRDDRAAAVAAERERLADLWAGCTTEAEGHGQVDIGASIRAGRLIDAA